MEIDMKIKSDKNTARYCLEISWFETAAYFMVKAYLGGELKCSTNA